MVGAGQLAPPMALAGFSLERLTAPVLLAFFKITCPTCQLTFPFLQRLVDRGGPRVVGISQDGPEGTAEFQEAFGVRFELVYDRAEDGYGTSNAYGLTHVPGLLLVEPEGRIVWTSEGFSRPALEELAARFGVQLFEAGDRVPNFKPG